MNTLLRYALSICLALASLAAVAEHGLYGMYSNMNLTAGHLAGMEMFFINDGRPGKCSQSVLLQTAEGAPQYPELLDCCNCTVSRVAFTSNKWGQFIGHIDNGSLVGEFIDSKNVIKLDKRNSYWQNNDYK